MNGDLIRENIEFFGRHPSRLKYETHPSKRVWGPVQVKWATRWLAPGMMLLDAGGGYGFQADGITKVIPDCVIIGLDVSRQSLLERVEDHPQLQLNVQADMFNLPFSDCVFDGILFFGALHHTLWPMNVLSECRRVIRDKGRLLLVEPNSLAMWVSGTGFGMVQNGLEFRFSLPFLLQQIELAGFVIVDVQTQVLSSRLLGRVFKPSYPLFRLCRFVDSLLLRLPGLKYLGAAAYIVAIPRNS